MARRRIGSVTTRLVTLFFVLQLVANAAILFYVRQSIATELTRDQQAFVAELRHDLVAWHSKEGDAALAREIRQRLTTLKGENLLLLMTDRSGRFVAGNLDAWPPVVAADTRWQTLDLFRAGSQHSERIGVSAAPLPGGAHLLAGRVIDGDLQLTQLSERVLVVALAIGVPLALLIAVAATWLIERRIIGIAATARAVGSGDFASRVDLDGSGDAFDRLGAGFNSMLARVERLVDELRVVTGGLAHDLRAPIFRITATLEQAMQDTDDPSALAAMDRVATEAGVLQNMLATAMQIAQAEAGIGRNRFTNVDVAEMLTGIAELYEYAAEDGGLAVRVIGEVGSFSLHRELVGQAIGNLIDNAINHADGASTILLVAERIGEGLCLSVADDGVGIATADHAAALRRFGRLDPSRHEPGAGLGLALVEAVAKLHGGRVTLEDSRPGLRVVMVLAIDGTDVGHA